MIEQIDNARPLAGQPAFVLGNSPRLLAEQLWRLDAFLTVGVNRICRVYDPTVLIWVDASVGEEIAPLLPTRKCLRLCPESMCTSAGAIGLDFRAGSRRLSRTPRELHCDGNTGVAAAGWVLSLGCRPVYLLGMDARYRAGATDFYGVNPHHRDGTLQVMRHALQWLQAVATDDVVGVHGERQLIDIVRRLAPLARCREWYERRILSALKGDALCPKSSTT